MAERRRSKNKDSKKASSSAPTAATDSTPSRPRPATRPPGTTPIPWTLFLIFTLVPLLKLAFSPEAPARPFSLVYPSWNALLSVKPNEPPLEPTVVRPRILLVTAHPDDEVLFAPTLLALSDESRRDELDLWVLTLSSGDAAGEDQKARSTIAARRTAELGQSLDVLRVRDERRILVESPKLKDNASVRWDAVDVARAVEPYVREHSINTVLTFDNWGVTNHPNHFAIPYGILALQRSLASTKSASSTTPLQLYTLTSAHWNQHLGPLSPILAQLSLAVNQLYSIVLVESGLRERPSIATLASPINAPPVSFISDVNGWWSAVRAARLHESQWESEGGVMGWAVLALARYLWVNEWTLVATDIPERSYLSVGAELQDRWGQIFGH